VTDERKIELDGLRGYAAIVVVICHSILGLDTTQIERIVRGQWSSLSFSESTTKIVLKIFDGEAAVMLFFVLSGAVLFRSLMREDGNSGTVAFKFYVRRFFRIYPALLVCLVACGLALAARGRSVTMDDFTANVLLSDFRINGATWTMNAEMIAPAFLLLCCAGYRAAREWGLVTVILILSGLLQLPLFEGYLISFKNSWYCFALGALIPTRLGRAGATVLPRWSWLAAVVCIVLLRWPLRELCVAVLVMMLYYRRADAIQPFLSNRVSQFLGRISFSFYLFNVLFLEWMCDWMRQYPWVIAHTLEAGAGVALAVILCTIPVAYLSWAYIEMPFNRLGYLLTGGTTAASHQAVAMRVTASSLEPSRRSSVM
jgi:peptidoglycan/LPS O-acetylase OafA/YrhL